MLPFNLTRPDSVVDYVHTGSWGTKAIAAARKLCQVNIAASSEDGNFTYAPPPAEWRLTPGAAYVHVTGNETIGGVEYHDYPSDLGAPLAADLSSTVLSRPLDVSRFGVIYAGAQKNIGPVGLTIVVIRKDLAGRARPDTPDMLDYLAHAKAGSMMNTPPTYNWYLAGLVFAWLKDLGGLPVMAARNRRKADKLYAAIDASDFYRCPVRDADRSWMNVPFTLADPALDRRFLDGAEAAGLANLKGHRSVGGMRASLYNAVSEEAVDALIDFMAAFERDAG